MISRVKRVKGAWVSVRCEVCGAPSMGTATCIEILTAAHPTGTLEAFAICMRCARRIKREVDR